MLFCWKTAFLHKGIFFTKNNIANLWNRFLKAFLKFIIKVDDKLVYIFYTHEENAQELFLHAFFLLYFWQIYSKYRLLLLPYFSLFFAIYYRGATMQMFPQIIFLALPFLMNIISNALQIILLFPSEKMLN